MKSIVILALVLTGCAAHQWAPGPGQSVADFEPAKARCSLLARHGGSDFVAIGSQNYVAGATLGHAIGESIRANQDFNDCMVASGWSIADGQTVATRTAAAQSMAAQLKVIKDERIACVAEIRNKPAYASLQPHFSELGTGGFTMTQLADEHIPTLAESHLMTTYIDEVNPCINKSISATSQVAPAVGPMLLQAKSADEEAKLLLIQRKLTWGESAQRQKQAQAELTAKLREVRL